MSARELYEFLEIRTRFNDWFSRMIEYGFSESNDFTRVAQKCPTPGGMQTIIDYAITIDMYIHYIIKAIGAIRTPKRF